MSENPPPKKARVARVKSDGKYLGGKVMESTKGPMGPQTSSKLRGLSIQPLRDSPSALDWLSDRGVDEKNWFQIHCSICPATFQCKIQNIVSHEISKSHKDKAAARLKKQQAQAGWQEQLNKGADYTAVQRAAQAAHPKLHTQFACVFKTLQQGRPITDVCAEEAFLKFIKAPSVPDKAQTKLRQSSAFSVKDFPYPGHFWVILRKEPPYNCLDKGLS